MVGGEDANGERECVREKEKGGKEGPTPLPSSVRSLYLSLVAIKSAERPNNRPADIHSKAKGRKTERKGREVDRDDVRRGGVRDYTPEGNRREGISTNAVNDPRAAYTYNATGIVPDYPRKIGDFDLLLSRPARPKSVGSLHADEIAGVSRGRISIHASKRAKISWPLRFLFPR